MRCDQARSQHLDAIHLRFKAARVAVDIADGDTHHRGS
jgi:hypothetical protein